jgi:DNA-binding NarL/FixJ family response regulator
MKTNIILVDDNVQFRTNLKHYIESDLDCLVIDEASNGREFLDLPGLATADVILMDIAMDTMDGIEATKQALWRYSFLKIIAITMHTERIFLVQLLETGFKGCVFKSDMYNQLGKAIQHVKAGKFFLPNNISLYKNH